MGLEEVEADIKKRIESKVATIKNAGEKEASGIIGNAKARVKELAKIRENEIEKLVSDLKNREIAAANLSARKLKMGAKKDAMEKVYAKVKGRLLDRGSAERGEILRILIEGAKKELPSAKFVLCNAGEKEIVEKLVRGSGIRVDGTAECSGGIIVENSDHSVRIDYTYDALLEQFRKNALKDVAAQLFGETNAA